MNISDFLASEWKPALGCTEPASIAYAASLGASCGSGPIKKVHLVCDRRIYKNCYAVGIPNSGHKVGIKWALALGCLIPRPELKLECFKALNPGIMEEAGLLLNSGSLKVEIDKSKSNLFISCRVERSGNTGFAEISGDHTNVVRLEKNGEVIPLEKKEKQSGAFSAGSELEKLSLSEIVELAQTINGKDRKSLRDGAAMNIAIARHGLSLFPKHFVEMSREDPLTRISRLVCAGVYARMWGEDYTVMSLAGSGNKGITCSVPLYLYGKEASFPTERIDESLALACLVTSFTTQKLGTLSAVCGCANAAGIGLSAGLTFLEGGGEEEISMAINNMVGNITGIICDGAKIGCALKTMTSVDSAFRSVSLALSGIGIPFSDGVVGEDGEGSISNLGRIATRGMAGVDNEILSIMEEKLLKKS